MIKIFMADDHSIVREGMRSLFSSAADMEIVGEASDGDEALREIKACKPTVFLMDMSMPGCSGLELIEKVRRLLPETLVLVLSMHREDLYAVRCIRAGAHGFVTKTRPPAELLGAVRDVARGKIFVTPELAAKLVQGAITGKLEEEPHASLSKREYEIFIDLANGLTVGEISEKLNVSPKTVSTHKARLMEKLGVDTFSDLIRYALTYDLL